MSTLKENTATTIIKHWTVQRDVFNYTVNTRRRKIGMFYFFVLKKKKSNNEDLNIHHALRDKGFSLLGLN